MRRFKNGGNAIHVPTRLGIRGSQERATALWHQCGNLQDFQRMPSNLIAVPARPPSILKHRCAQLHLGHLTACENFKKAIRMAAQTDRKSKCWLQSR